MSTEAEDAQERVVQVVTQVRLAGVPLVMVEDTETEDEHGAPQSIRRWAASADADVAVSTLTTTQLPDPDPAHVAGLVREQAAGAVLVGGMRRGEGRAQLQEEVRAARAVQPQEADDVLRLDGSPVPGAVVVVTGARVVGGIAGPTVVVVTADDHVDLSLGEVRYAAG